MLQLKTQLHPAHRPRPGKVLWIVGEAPRHPDGVFCRLLFHLAVRDWRLSIFKSRVK